MRLVFFSHYYFPEGNAPASRTHEHCLRWVKAGHEVSVITGVPNVPLGIPYAGYRNSFWPRTEIIDGVKVIRVWTCLAPNKGMSRRVVNYLSYMCSAVIVFLFWVRRPHLVLATSPQFFCGWAGVFASWLKLTPLVLEIRDIWPESITTVGAMRRGLVIRSLEQLEKWMYRSSRHIITVGNGYRENICAKVGMRDRISVITNGVDTRAFAPRESDPEFLERFQLTGRFVCSYVGTIGMAHGLDVVLRAAERLKQRGRHDMVFLLVGDGASRASLERASRERQLEEWVRFAGQLPKASIPTVLASSHCVLVHLIRSELFETVIPSKIFESMAMRRPIIMGVRGEAEDIVRASGSGIAIEPENDQELADAVCRMRDDAEFYASLQMTGREFVVANYSRDALADRFLKILEIVAAARAIADRNKPLCG